MNNNWTYFVVILIFWLGFGIRLISVYPDNTIFGFDQARDFFDATVIFRDHHLRIIGPTAGNNANLHHGVAYFYYILPPLFFLGGNPIWVVLWNSLFNSATALIIYILSKQVFQKTSAAFISSLIVAFSYQFVQYSGWLSNPTATLWSVPIFFLGLWNYYLGKKWGLLVAAFFLGLSIQFELFFVYLIPVLAILWILLKLRLPSLKLFLLSLITFLISISSMIATEIYLKFSGILSLASAGSLVGGPKLPFYQISEQFFQRFWEAFSLSLWPQRLDLGIVLGIIMICLLLLEILRNKSNQKILHRNIFVLVYLFSPAIMLVLGYHNAPWFLIGLPPAVALISGYTISKIKPRFLILVVVFLMVANNFSLDKQLVKVGQNLLEPDKSAILKKQLLAVDYTYQQSGGRPFTINSLTNPLYINAVWAYHYPWYGAKKYGFLPSWSGGDQLYPYNSLPKKTGREKYLYLLIDTTFRIPYSHRLALIGWADQKSKLIEEKDFDGILVQKREVIN